MTRYGYYLPCEETAGGSSSGRLAGWLLRALPGRCRPACARR